MRALCWNGPNSLSVETVPDPIVVKPHDAIIQVRMSSTCGSDLHIISGLLPSMRAGDVIGHEFTGEVVEVGKEVKNVRKGDRVVVPSPIGCGNCYYCRHEQWSLCDNSNPDPEVQEKVLGYPTAGIYGFTHAFGGYAGSHAEYIRVPFADSNTFKVPTDLPDEKIVFLSDAAPTGYMGADLCAIRKGDVVAVWGCGGVGQMAIQSAYILGAERVIAIDRFPERLAMARDYGKAEVLNYEEVDVVEALREMTGGRGPDACIDCVGMESHGVGLLDTYDRVKQVLHLETDRGQSIREALVACRKGGVVAVMGVYSNLDKFPLGVAMNKGLTLRMAQQFGQKYIPRLIDHVKRGELDTSYLVTHRMSLEEAPHGYEIFRNKEDNCVRVVFVPRMEAHAA